MSLKQHGHRDRQIVAALRKIHVIAKKERKETLRTIEKPLDFMFRKCKNNSYVPVKTLD
jgi:hypothetical protein